MVLASGSNTIRLNLEINMSSSDLVLCSQLRKMVMTIRILISIPIKLETNPSYKYASVRESNITNKNICLFMRIGIDILLLSNLLNDFE